MRRGQAEGRTPDYLRHGTINLFAALDFKAAPVIGEFHQQRRVIELRKFLAIYQAVPAALQSASHRRSLRHPQDSSDQCRLLRQPRFHLLFTRSALPGSTWSSAGSGR